MHKLNYTRTKAKGILLSGQADRRTGGQADMAQSIRLVVLTKNLNFVKSTTPPYTRYTFAQNKKLHVFCINIFYYSL